LQTTTHPGFPHDELRDLLRHLIRVGGLLEPERSPHEHGGLKVSMSEVFALGELSEVEAMSQQDLADHLGLEKSTVSRLAAGMESRGWISRERDPSNRRFYRLALTSTGREAASRVGQDLHEHHTHLLTHLSPAEQQALRIGLSALIRAVTAESNHPE
jgi:DNA-binding MarR family transcriptional regulator